MKILCGDCAEVMKQIESDSIDLVVTSPPTNKFRGRPRNGQDWWSKLQNSTDSSK